MKHKQYLNYVALRTVRYSWRFPTVDTTLLYIQSVNNTNITVHNFNVSLLWSRTLCNISSPVPHQHHFHTQDCISQTVRSDLKGATVLMYWDICMYIGYQQFGFWYLMEEKLGFTFIFILPLKGPHIRNLKGHILRYLGGAPYLKLKSRCGYAEYLLILSGCIVLWIRRSIYHKRVGMKATVCVWLTTLPPSCADCLEILGASNSCSTKGWSRPVLG